MFRPPKPSSKANALFPVLVSNPNNSNTVRNIGSSSNTHLQMIVRNGQRSSSKETAKYTININTRKTEDSQVSQTKDPNPNTISPNNQLLDVTQNSQKLISPPNLFKIRQLSSQSKRSKQNVQPNLNKSVELKNPKFVPRDTAIKQFIEGDQNDNINYQCDQLKVHPLQQKLKLISSKTGSMMLNNSQKSNNMLCFIISECIFEQGITKQSTLLKLKNICQQLKKSYSQCVIVLKVYNNINSCQLKQQIQGNRIKINYLIWNQQRYASTLTVYNLSKIATQLNVHNFVILSDASSTNLDIYCDTTNSTYAYFKINGYTGLIKFINSLSIQLKNTKSNQQNQIHISKIFINKAKCDSIRNQTNQIYKNNQVIQTIHMAQTKQLVQRASKNGHSRSKSAQEQKEKQKQWEYEEYPQFNDIYKNKLVQFIKLLNLQTKNNNNSANGNNAQYFKLAPHEKIAQVMECMISANTAYQIAGQITRNNGFNYAQVKQFRDKHHQTKL